MPARGLPAPHRPSSGSPSPQAIGSSGQAQLGGSPDLPPGDLASPLLHAMDGYQGDGMLPQAAVLQQQSGLGGGGSGAGGGTGASIYIKGMPEDADKLWL